jgi:predicted phosphohydrolase
MTVSFDLISDLHVETWPEPFDWTGMATSIICVVAGDISRDRELVYSTLEHLGQCYKAVIYIDGNDEHRYSLSNLQQSVQEHKERVKQIPNVIYLLDNVVVIDGLGFVGVNGWWTFDFDNAQSYDQSKEWFVNHYKVDKQAVDQIEAHAFTDVQYLSKSIKRLQTHQDVSKLVVVTHTVPDPELVEHDIDLEGTHRLNCLGNNHILKSFIEDTENKIETWCFGHYHGDIDKSVNGVRFVNNCRGRANTDWCKSVYNPKKIFVDV